MNIPPEPPQMTTELLLMLAFREIDSRLDQPNPYLIELHRRGGPEIFDAAAALLGRQNARRRELGVLILRELQDKAAIPLLRARLGEEQDYRVLGWIVSALGYHGAVEAVPELVALAGHETAWVRFFVASALPGLADQEAAEPAVLDALLALCHDEDDDIRWYALYAITQELAGVPRATVRRITGELLDDPDEKVRQMAAEFNSVP